MQTTGKLMTFAAQRHDIKGLLEILAAQANAKAATSIATVAA